MTVRVAINGFGRIGRLVARAIAESKRKDIVVVGINDLAPADTNAHLFRYDSVHGRFPGKVTLDGDTMDFGLGPVRMTSERNPADLPWKDLKVDIALECTGIFADKEKASAHLKAGAKRVLISAPATGVDKTIVFGVNDETLSADDIVVSNASCTTNCLAPVAKVLNDRLGIKTGFMTTIHAYTNDQHVLDQFHKDPYRARAAAQNMIPTSTGAARAVGLVLPDLNGKLDGSSVRVPTANVSVIDLKAVVSRKCDVEKVQEIMIKASKSRRLKGILNVTDEPLVSSDLNHDPASSTVVLSETKVMGDKFVRVMSWYDNEWGFSNRMLDTASAMGALL
ncbi:MAG: type I glyceraldehyde-3-phosphate dehydrogenase [Rhodobiaceae bacterium]|nr:type I glyceraldehyde-3-phosphate dehydrogenase [Rhodobiaceae bacterium]MCC0018510.1 type I glyceraldehyde-3-phosphate dehydrogenase [Rhodobiaceae bacterium]